MSFFMVLIVDVVTDNVIAICPCTISPLGRDAELCGLVIMLFCDPFQIMTMESLCLNPGCRALKWTPRRVCATHI